MLAEGRGKGYGGVSSWKGKYRGHRKGTLHMGHIRQFNCWVKPVAVAFWRERSQKTTWIMRRNHNFRHSGKLKVNNNCSMFTT